MNNTPYSVVIPAFNAARFIRQTLQSVLDQTVPPEKIIVVDDGSTDGTVDIVRELDGNIQIISTPNNGPGAATTTGVSRVRTPVLATLDADDLWRPEKMQNHLDLLDQNGLELDGVLCRMLPFGETDKKTASEERSGWSRSTLTIRTKAFLKVGDVYDMDHKYGDMIDWFARAKQAGLNFHMIELVLADRRIHSGSLSFNAGIGQREDFLRVARRALERKRSKR